jgi:DNA-binding IclR family transcriptional regulator
MDKTALTTMPGLVAEDVEETRDRRGIQSIEVGGQLLLALGRTGKPMIATLSTDTSHTVAIAVWGNMGPTIIRVEESSHALHVNLRTGTVMSLLNTATGLIFAAFLPPKAVEGMIKNEADRVGGLADPPSRKKVEGLLAEVRRHGLARVAGAPIPGINAVSAPVFRSRRQHRSGSYGDGTIRRL